MCKISINQRPKNQLVTCQTLIFVVFANAAWDSQISRCDYVGDMSL